MLSLLPAAVPVAARRVDGGERHPNSIRLSASCCDAERSDLFSLGKDGKSGDSLPRRGGRGGRCILPLGLTVVGKPSRDAAPGCRLCGAKPRGRAAWAGIPGRAGRADWT